MYSYKIELTQATDVLQCHRNNDLAIAPAPHNPRMTMVRSRI